MTDIRASRCEDLRQALTELTPLLIEAQGDAGRLPQALPPVRAVQAVAAAGAEGIDDPAYRAWATGAVANLDALEGAVSRGDAKGAWAAFTDQQAGVAQLAQGCAGYPGW